MAERKQYTILCSLKNVLGITEVKFREYFLGDKRTYITKTSPTYWQNIVCGDYLTKEGLEIAEISIKNKIKWIETVQSIVLKNRKEIFDEMKEIFKNSKKSRLVYARSNPSSANKKPDDIFCDYDVKSKKCIFKHLKELEKGIHTDYEFVQLIWCIVYLAVFKCIPTSFANDKIQLDYEEYNISVVKTYGSVTIPAQRAIVELAEKENVVAQVALGDLFYYGRFTGGVPQYRKAYSYFLKAAGSLDDEDGVHLPLACWKVAYMLFNYRFRRELKKTVIIKELESIPQENRIRNAIQYCILAIKKDERCIQAYNLLGVILNILEITENLMFIKDEILKNDYLINKVGTNLRPETFFGIAAEEGYVEAMNNLWQIACRKAFQMKDGSEEEKKLLDVAIGYLEQSASKHCTWANNKLGELYREGYMNVYLESIEKYERKTYTELIDPDKARWYYLRAIECFIDQYSAWAAFHLLETFYDDLDEDTLSQCHDIILAVRNKEVVQKYNDWKKQILLY